MRSTLRENCPYSEFFWSFFSEPRLNTERYSVSTYSGIENPPLGTFFTRCETSISIGVLDFWIYLLHDLEDWILNPGLLWFTNLPRLIQTNLWWRCSLLKVCTKGEAIKGSKHILKINKLHYVAILWKSGKSLELDYNCYIGSKS